MSNCTSTGSRRSCCWTANACVARPQQRSDFSILTICIVLLNLQGAAKAQQYFPGWTSEFPFEPCVRSPASSRYQLSLDSYVERKTLSTFCLRLNTVDADSCDPSGTRCCKTDFKKLKMYPNPNCARSVDSFQINNQLLSRAITWDIAGNKTTVKLTPLGILLATANNTVICINIKAPCGTLDAFSPDGQLLQYAMYDVKRNNYECCPMGAIDVTEVAQSPLLDDSSGDLTYATTNRQRLRRQ